MCPTTRLTGHRPFYWGIAMRFHTSFCLLLVWLACLAGDPTVAQDKKEPSQHGMTLSQAIKLLESNEVLERMGAIDALGKFAAPAVPALIAALHDKNVLVSSRALSTLVQLGPVTERAMPILIAALKDQNVVVRSSAADVLSSIGPGAIE